MPDAPYTYGNLKAEVTSSIWPNDAPVEGGQGVYGPENLQTAISRMMLQAVNWLQQNIDCLKEEHLDVTAQCNTYFHCGLSVIDKPDGVIRGLFTVQRSGFCNPVTYDEVSKDEILKWSRWLMKIVTSPENGGLTALPGGFTQAATSTDSEWGRALVGKWAKDGDRILISPWLQSDEDVAVDWTGYKSKWNDSDLVTDAPDFKRAVKLFVQREFARDFERDPGFAQFANDDLHGNPGRGIFGAIPALMHQCREKTRQRQAQHNAIESDYLWLNYVKPETTDAIPEDSTVLAVIGDYGSDGTPEADVAALVASWSPSHIITAGNNNYPAGAVATIDANVGKHYVDWITPYHGIYGVERGTNRFWPSLGNRDLDQTVPSLASAYLNYFALPSHGDNNERYYDKVFGHVHVFFINSGYNTAGDLVEPDGNTDTGGCVQAQWILMRAVKSTVRWKIAVFNSPPYSSQAGIAKPALRWKWAKYGFDAVISAGDSKSYERIIVDDFPYFVNGIGGAGLVPFTGSAVTGSGLQYAANYGAMKITATCSALNFLVENIDGDQIDSYDIT